MSRSLSIAIIGCGTAGLAAALLLERAGHKVTLVERFSEPQPLGSGLILQPSGLAVLAELGLAAPLIATGSRIDRLFGLNAATGSVVLDVRYAALKRERFGVGIHRAALFEELFTAVQRQSIAIETGVEVGDIDASAGGKVSLIAASGRRIGPFDLVVDASGTRSPLLGHAVRPVRQVPLRYGALWANVPLGETGFDRHALEQRYRRASVMVGVLPIGRHGEQSEPQAALFWSLKADALDGWRSAGLAAWKAEVERTWPATAPLLAHIADPEQLTFASYRHQTLPRPYGQRIAFIGDAAHSTSPQLGQGANMALLDAYALAVALNQAADLDGALRRYAQLRRWHVRLYQAASRMFTPFYQSDSAVLPVIRDRVVPPLARLPGIDRMLALLVSGLIGDPLRRLGLKEPAIAGESDRPALAGKGAEP
ncbi:MULTISPECIES: NAD(P)/FAD-dependent oxidoreductase [unclassified Bosea (in: a-proteobacteria)]|uniref:FAD-dependent oxidoreductase n=1 Tax=unclassified Bosea (in: a-proteobacteria) TaxID=2653178 RepID=UPI000F753D99|nr:MULTISPECIES: NAD(P)/FAD-dependent oxidoreductase [unclassified Bosea (in: a-proteobacteria)]AZO76476.1 glutamate synthase [Bosea sp. Tri-49]RXT26402.1 glutamate synthase [Bosea sp. Tri-39]RXT31643.1 glutamate synthase [Bosea sp. Tri-54]